MELESNDCNKGGPFENVGEWDRYVDDWARKIRNPLKLTISK